MRKHTISFLLVLFSLSVTAQDFQIPVGYQFKVKEDYAPYEKDIIAAANWLMSVPLDQQNEKRKEVSTFVFRWIDGSPTVNVSIDENIVNFDKANPGMLILYMAQCAKYVLENNYSKDVIQKNKAALHAMIVVYKSGKGIEKDKKMEKMEKADDDGKLEQWIKSNLTEMKN